MKAKNIVFCDLLKCLPQKRFQEMVERHAGDKWSKHYSSWDLFITLLQGQLIGATSLRMMVLSYQCQEVYLKQLNAKKIPRSTVSDACKVRSPEIWMEVLYYMMNCFQGRHKKITKTIKPFIHLIDSTPLILKGHG